MAPLNSLENEYPLIDSNFQTFCASHAIYSGSFPLILFPTFSNSIFQILFIQCHHYSFFSSVEDFLLHDLDALLTSAAKHSTSQRLKQGIHQLLSIVDALHPPLINGLQLLEDFERNKEFLSTGCEGIDAFLGGGLREGQLTELVGPSSSGKTQVRA
ncbi:DNA repair protein rad51d, variant 5 [Lathyrus oleraceus]|uniref:DNA repair protein rad51d, variant 5 n=1 Tax=Pisum sativum TaxID=3888 RepID=A0A9D4VV78_PEA|nr:DNA repair protein rad51d, variant 5 [Pisum sativum]